MGAHCSGARAPHRSDALPPKAVNKDKPVAFTKEGAFYPHESALVSVEGDSRLGALRNGTKFAYLPSAQLGKESVSLVKPGPLNENTSKYVYLLTTEMPIASASAS